MLEGLLLVDEARSAGLTNSPDFLRISEGLIDSSSSSISLSDARRAAGGSNLVRGNSKNALSSVLDLEWEILRAPGDKDNLGEMIGISAFVFADGSGRGAGRPRVKRALLVSSLD